MIIISKATKKETKEWRDAEWKKTDLELYGGPIHWIEKKFRFKAEENGKLLGTINGKFESGVLYVGNIIISDTARGKGIGTMLMQKAEEFGKKLGAHTGWLITGTGWPSNSFYQKLGFTKLADIPHFYYNKPFVIYTREIK